MDLAREMPFRVDDVVLCTGMSRYYGSKLEIGKTYTVSHIRSSFSVRESDGASSGEMVQWIGVIGARNVYEAKYFDFVQRPYNENNVTDCIQDFIKTIPKKGKTCQAKTETKNTSS